MFNLKYDALGQVTSGKKYWPDGTPVAGEQFEYGYDDIGNRKYAAEGGNQLGGNLRYENYAVNSLNQYSQRTVPAAVDVLGAANPTATVTVNLKPAYRKAEFYRAEYPLNNSTGSVWLTLTNVGVLANGTNADIVTTNTGALFVPKTPELFTYDLDGNLKSDGHWTNFWDGDNRLIQMDALSTVPVPARQRLVFSYDSQGRRIRKTVYNWNTTSGSFADVSSDTKFVYDGWNLMGELNGTNNALVCAYAWGTDLSGSKQRAAGVGGLLWTAHAEFGIQLAVYDGNGNVIGLVDAVSGTNSASYEFDHFGRGLKGAGAGVAASKILFSTKYVDHESGFRYYGYRFLGKGRWLSRDPRGELGGKNLFAFCRNSVGLYDGLGLTCSEAIGKDGQPRIIFTVAPPKGGWKVVSVNPAEDYVGGDSGGMVYSVPVKWEANVSVLCQCGSCTQIRSGVRELETSVEPQQGGDGWPAYQLAHVPTGGVGVPIITTVAEGLGELLALGAEELLANLTIIMDETSWDDIVGRIAAGAPSDPHAGSWKGGVSPCAQ